VGRVSVTLNDALGRVKARAGEATYEGALLSPPRAIALGQKLALSLARIDVVPPEDPLELSGKVVEVAHMAPGVKNTPLHAGLRFTLDVGEIARGASTSDSLVKRRSGVFRRPDPVIASLGQLPVFDDLDATSQSDTVLAPPPVITGEEAHADPFPYSTSDELMREPTGVIGTLRHVSMPEVIQGLEIGRRTAQIDVRAGDDGRRGTVFLKYGQVVAAHFAHLAGEEAFYVLAAQRIGTYRVRFEREAPQINVTAPTAFLLLEAMRKLDEENSKRGLEPPKLPELTGEFRAVPANITLPPPPTADRERRGPGSPIPQRMREAKTRNKSDRVRRRTKDVAQTTQPGARSTFSSFFKEASVEESGDDDPAGELGSIEESFISLRVKLKGIGDSQRQFVGDTDWSRVMSSSESSGPSSPSNH
jgi:hypothetical protein